MCNLKHNLLKNSCSFHNQHNYDYHFIIKEVAVEFKKELTCLGENTENT